MGTEPQTGAKDERTKASFGLHNYIIQAASDHARLIQGVDIVQREETQGKTRGKHGVSTDIGLELS